MSTPVLKFQKTPTIEIQTAIQAVGSVPSLQQTISVIGHRTGFVGINETGGFVNPLVPVTGYPQVQYYFPFTMPSFANGQEALSYMKNLGFTVNYGTSGSLSFPVPDHVTVNANGSVTLSYLTAPANYSLLSAPNITGTVTQTTSAATGTFSFTSNNLTFSSVLYPANVTVTNVSGTFDTTALHVITVNYIGNGSSLPNPNLTEEIAMMMYYLYNGATVVGGAQYTFQKPNVLFTLLSDRDSLANSSPFAPDPTPLALGVPDKVAVVGANTLIGYIAAPNTAGYVPLQPLGSSFISQVTSGANGVIMGVLPAQIVAGTFCNFVIEVGPTGSAFDTTHIASLNLDATQTVFVTMDGQTFTSIVSPYDVATNTDINTNQAQFFAYINSVNQPTEIEKGHFGVFGVFANTSIPATQISTLPTAVNSNIPGAPAQWLAPVYFPYAPNVGEVPQSSAMIAAAYAGFFSSNTVPFNPMSSLTIPGVQSSANTANRVTYGVTGAICSEIALDLGWSPLCVSQTGTVYPARLVTGQVTLPGTAIVDQEFFPLTTWQIVQNLQFNLYQAQVLAGIKQLRMTPLALKNVQGACAAVAKNMELEGMLMNANYWVKYITVTKSNIADTILIQFPAQIVPELASAFTNVGLISSLVTVS